MNASKLTPSSRPRFLFPLSVVVAVAAAAGLAACESSTGPSSGSTVSIGFRAASSASASMSDVSAERSVSPGVSAAVEYSGTNGTLSVDSAHIVVSEFELSRAGVDCDDDDPEGSEGDDDDCEEFESGPKFIGLPLDGGTTVTVSQQVPAGTYEELEFEVDDLEDDDDDGEEHRAEQDLLQEIRSQFENWPHEASVRVTGTFTPADQDSEPRPYTAYFEAEIEVEREFESPLVIEDDADDKSVTVTVDPSAWFELPDGTVVDLSRFDYESTGRVAEIEIEMEDGFTEVEFED